MSAELIQLNRRQFLKLPAVLANRNHYIDVPGLNEALCYEVPNFGLVKPTVHRNRFSEIVQSSYLKAFNHEPTLGQSRWASSTRVYFVTNDDFYNDYFDGLSIHDEPTKLLAINEFRNSLGAFGKNTPFPMILVNIENIARQTTDWDEFAETSTQVMVAEMGHLIQYMNNPNKDNIDSLLTSGAIMGDAALGYACGYITGRLKGKTKERCKLRGLAWGSALGLTSLVFRVGPIRQLSYQITDAGAHNLIDKQDASEILTIESVNSC